MLRIGSQFHTFAFLAAVALVLLGSHSGHGKEPELPKRTLAPARDGENLGVLVSTGDNSLVFTSMPVDSPAAIEESLDVFSKVFRAKRLYWRDPQIEQLVYHSKIREQSFFWGGQEARWEDDRLRGTGQHAIKAAKARGLEIWGYAALFDHQGSADTYSMKGWGPFVYEGNVRLRFPEAIPVDRAGLRRMPGPVSFAYPEARKFLVDLYAGLVKDRGYDGLTFHCYIENFDIRFEDEFGFNEPIRQEFKKRHGVDIRTQPYDREALADLRGEYLTQFFRELRAAFKPLKVKIGIFLSAKHPDLPQRWNGNRELTQQRVRVDWPRYVDEKLVDDFLVYNDGGPVYETLRKVRDRIGDQPITVGAPGSQPWPRQHRELLARRGVYRVMSADYGEELYGYFDKQPVSALDSKDLLAKLSVLYQMAAGMTPPDRDRILAATRDKSILVRRQALWLIAFLGQAKPGSVTPDVIAAIEARLNDPENFVRATALNTLALVGGPESTDKLYQMLAKHGNPMTFLTAQVPLGSWAATRNPELRRGLEHPSQMVRWHVLRVLSSGRMHPELVQAVIANAGHKEASIRWGAASALMGSAAPEALDCLGRLLDDPHPTVRSMAALNLSAHLAGKQDTDRYKQVLGKLRQMFGAYGQGSQAADADWGWRPVGESLLRLGPQGKTVLEDFMAQKEDAQLADLAWRVLYVRLTGYKARLITREEAKAGYRAYPAHGAARK